MAPGFLLRQIKLLSEPTVKQTNQFVFKAVHSALICGKLSRVQGISLLAMYAAFCVFQFVI